MAEYKRIRHTFAPVYDEKSRILILGSFPSVKSREEGFFYGHPQNRFWKVLAGICNCKVPVTIEEKKDMLLENRIAIWDVIDSCDIIGSSDSSIKNVIPADLSRIMSACTIEHIYTNGKTAGKLYRKYMLEQTKMEAVELPSTSPANAVYTLEKLMNAWKDIQADTNL